MKKVKTPSRIFLLLIIILLPAFLAVSIINYYLVRDAIREELVNTSLPLVREHIYLNISRQLQEPLLTSQLMAGDTFLIDWVLDGEETLEEIQNYLYSIRAAHGYSSTFFVSSLTNRYYSYEGLHKKISRTDDHDIWYYDFVKTGKEIEFDVDTDEVLNGLLTVFINVRVEDSDGNFLGVAGVGLNMRDIASLLQSTQEAYGRKVYLVDERGTIQAHSDISMIEKSSIRTMEGIEEIASDLLSSRIHPITGEYRRDGDTILLTSEYLPSIDWYIVVEQNMRDSLRLARANLLRSLLVALVISVLIIIISRRLLFSHQRELELISTTDHLTGLYNRLAIEEQLVQILRRNRSTAGLLMIDIDNFKAVNDTCGHAAGDAVLREFARSVTDVLPKGALAGRWGGDEFIALIPAADWQSLQSAASLCRTSIAERTFSGGLQIHISIGITMQREEDTREMLLHRADTALYRAKNLGKNRIESEQ